MNELEMAKQLAKRYREPMHPGICVKNQIEAQRSGFDLERRSKGAVREIPARLGGDCEWSGLCFDAMSWDNGRTLAIVPTEDRFRRLPREGSQIMTMKL